jgi:ADP-ribose pyrophosphatase YjhB (NUDIX family)
MNNKKVICHDIEGKTYEVAANELTFRPSVYAIIIENDQVLLSRQWDGYDFPGGGVELGETLTEALKREVKEETGMEVSVEKVIHCQESFFKLPFKGNFVHSIHMYFACKVTGGKLSAEFLDEQEKKYSQIARWVNVQELPKVKMYSSTDSQEILQKYQEVTKK